MGVVLLKCLQRRVGSDGMYLGAVFDAGRRLRLSAGHASRRNVVAAGDNLPH